MPAISVLLPARNAAGTVAQAVSSTLADLPRDAELVVLDDGSTDGTASRLDGISDPRLRVLSHPGSGSLTRALNHLLAETDSRYVARMDADDVTLRGRFRMSLRALEHGADLAFTSALTQRGWRVAPSVPLPVTAEAFPYHLLLSNPVRHPSLLARRSSFEALAGYREVPSEDYDLWLRAALRGDRIVKSAWFGVRYRQHADQITASAEWTRQSRANVLVAEVFGELCERLLGRRFPRLVTLGPDSAATLAEFTTTFVDSTRHLPVGQRLALQRKLSSRQRQVQRSWS